MAEAALVAPSATTLVVLSSARCALSSTPCSWSLEVASLTVCFQTSASTPGGGSSRRCPLRRVDWDWSDTKVMPPDTTPPMTGITLETPWAKLFFVRLMPMKRRHCFMTGYHEVFVSACLVSCFWNAGIATERANTVSDWAAPPTPSMTPKNIARTPIVSSSTSSMSLRSSRHPYR